VISKNPDKDTETCLYLLVEELRTTQMNLDISLQGDNFLQNKLLMACQDHLACSIACSIPAITSTGLINNLRTSIVTYESVNKKQSQIQYLQDDDKTKQYFTDRRYHSNHQQNRYSQQRQDRYNRLTKGQFRRPQHNRTNQNNLSRPKVCFICKEENYWSIWHTQEERDEARAKYRATFDKEINRRFDQYIAEDEVAREDNTRDKLTDLTEEFKALVVKAKGTNAAEESDVFITEAGHPI
jgi:hypothetical protein